MTVQTVTVVGGALAGLRCCQALRRHSFAGPITVLAAEGPAAHNRPPLSKGLLTGHASEFDVGLGPEPALDLQWLAGVRATGFDLASRTLAASDGQRRTVDGLVVATGLTPHRMPCLPADLAGVHVLRGLDDAVSLRQDLCRARQVVVVGSGFIGTEVASSARSLDLAVTLVALEPPLSRVLGRYAQQHQQRLEDHGVEVHIGPGVVAARSAGGRVSAVELDDGRVLPADVVIVAVGGRPEVEWLRGSGISIDDGVLCGPDGAVQGADRVVAAGDVARCYSPLVERAVRVEHWANATDQAEVAAAGLLGLPTPPPPIPSFWTDQFDGRIQGVGLPAHADSHRLVDGDLRAGKFVLETHLNGRLIGAVVAGSPKTLISYRRELKSTVVA